MCGFPEPGYYYKRRQPAEVRSQQMPYSLSQLQMYPLHLSDVTSDTASTCRKAERDISSMKCPQADLASTKQNCVLNLSMD